MIVRRSASGFRAENISDIYQARPLETRSDQSFRRTRATNVFFYKTATLHFSVKVGIGAAFQRLVSGALGT